jgi:hypothetical protein
MCIKDRGTWAQKHIGREVRNRLCLSKAPFIELPLQNSLNKLYVHIFQWIILTIILLIQNRKQTIYMLNKIFMPKLFLFGRMEFWTWVCACKTNSHKTGILKLDLHFQSILLCRVWRWGVSSTVCLGRHQTAILLISANQVARITGMSY